MELDSRTRTVARETRRDSLLFERYEYVDAVFHNSGEAFEVKKILQTGGPRASEIVGFCRMSKPYTWPHFSSEFVNEFRRLDASSRSDELWLAFEERFVRMYPDRDVPETGEYARDLLNILEILLSTRAVNKSLLEQTQARVAALSAEVDRAVTKHEAASTSLISTGRSCQLVYS